MPKHNVVAVGSASQDVYLMGEALRAKIDVRTKEEVEKFPLGAKIELDDMEFTTGGGACNASVTFARQGLKTAYLGMVGDDPAGRHVQEQLEDEGVDTEFLKLHDDFHTMYSTFLLAPKGERTILIYRGAAHDMKASDFDFTAIDSEWIYLTSVAGDFELINAVVDAANDKGIKVAMDPGSTELKQTDKMRELIPKLTMIKGNKEEMMQITGGDSPQNILRELANHVDVAIVTDGPEGSWVTDGSKVVRGGIYEDVPVKDRTGAGDAFGSGFVAGLIRGMDIADSLVLGSANSTGVVQYIGSKAGIITANTELHDMDLDISDL